MSGGIGDYEKLGAFYLGRAVDPDGGGLKNEPLLYDAKDLTTHAVCVGMTGSGKTGLCVTLLEEAAIDRIPALVIDLKGDLANMLLLFPDLAPSSFEPWIDPGEASRKGMTIPERARKVAETWKKGLAEWGQDGARIQKLKDSVELALYTPGSNAGRQLTVLKSFNAPPQALLDDGDAYRERIAGATAALLTLMGIEADAVQSREHILLANILDTAWRDGRDLDIAAMLQQIQSPPFDKVGFFDLESFYPAKDRMKLAMSLNNLLASPGFSAWMEGEPLDVGRLLYTETGKPRLAIVSIAHLAESERMFFLSILLSEVNAWMRTQPGTSSLRALLYIDEVFGYLPPTKNPPTKIPLLTLLKQARAFGLGVVLATQNPVDLDYKALSNAGTWFLGRLQTERDKMRVLDGLEGASVSSGASFDRARIERLLSGLKSRVFLMNNVHEDEPVLFNTRWALSYLRGPLTRSQLKRIAADLPPPSTPRPTAPPAGKASAPLAAAARSEAVVSRPPAPTGVSEMFLSADRPGGGRLVYRPCLWTKAALHFAKASSGIDFWQETEFLAPLDDDTVSDPWEEALEVDDLEPRLSDEPSDGAAFDELPSAVQQKKRFGSWGKSLKDRLYRERTHKTWKCSSPREKSRPDEDEAAFRTRVELMMREKRDLEMEKLRARFEKKLATITDRLRRAEQKVEKEQEQYKQKKSDTAISIGATLLGALFGRKLASRGNVGRAATAIRGGARASKEKGDIARARESLEAQQEKLRELEADFEAEVEELEDLELEPEIVESPIRPRKTDIGVGELVLVWTPWVVSRSGIAEPAYS